ncbi:hypothetical protein GJ496_010812 [Pomphorhynchus laevis]|nr:hypothetical protein GJ496_010812 [Pomphorhynchus laevis]
MKWILHFVLEESRKYVRVSLLIPGLTVGRSLRHFFKCRPKNATVEHCELNDSQFAINVRLYRTRACDQLFNYEIREIPQEIDTTKYKITNMATWINLFVIG